MSQNRDLPVLGFESAAELGAWLAENHATSTGLWVKIGKRGAGGPSPTYDEALEVALCYGWIDGRKDPLDDACWLQRFTPRRRASRWSERNREKAIGLIAQGRMQPAGLREVESAKADGRWEAAYPSAATATVPDDLRRALESEPAARASFEKLDRLNRYAILYRIHDARKIETRAQRIAGFVTMLAEGRKPLP